MSLINARVAMTLVLALGAAACSSGGDDPAPQAATPPPAAAAPPAASDVVPASAFASTQALIAFMRALMADDSGEPLRIEATPPVDDTAEPTPFA